MTRLHLSPTYESRSLGTRESPPRCESRVRTRDPKIEPQVAPDAAEEKRAKVLTDVYKRHNKDGVEKVANLAAKADNPKKFGTLVHKLMQKFPKMVRMVKDPQTEYWENLMKEAQNNKGSDEPKKARRSAKRDDPDEEEDVEDLDSNDEL